jgi:hypothetical protein
MVGHYSWALKTEYWVGWPNTIRGPMPRGWYSIGQSARLDFFSGRKSWGSFQSSSSPHVQQEPSHCICARIPSCRAFASNLLLLLANLDRSQHRTLSIYLACVLRQPLLAHTAIPNVPGHSGHVERHAAASVGFHTSSRLLDLRRTCCSRSKQSQDGLHYAECLQCSTGAESTATTFQYPAGDSKHKSAKMARITHQQSHICRREARRGPSCGQAAARSRNGRQRDYFSDKHVGLH